VRPAISAHAKCKSHLVHPDTLRLVRESMVAEGSLFKLAEFFKVLGDSTRIKILHALHISEMCVCDLSELLGSSQSAVSHQLKTLRQAGLVRYRKEGRVVFYSLADRHVQRIIDQGLKHSSEPPIPKPSRR
jgi:DNA-binding transcriptional ArsR family regulator